MFVRLAKPSSLAMYTGEQADMFGYLEAGLLGSVIYSRAVKFAIVRFQNLFGTKLGETLIQWCQKYSLPLLWTLGVLPKDGACNWEFGPEKTRGHWESFVGPRLLEPRSSVV